MFNPFVNRSVEQIRDESAFLSVVTPAPLQEYLQEYAKDGRLYGQLAQVYGPPGTGKTTLARLFEFPVIAALLRNLRDVGYKETFKVLIACGAIDSSERPKIVGYRLGLEGQYRHIWELPYAEELRTKLLQSLIQARAVQGWLRGLQAARLELDDVEIIARPGGESVLVTIGGNVAADVLERARQVEQNVYEITAALDPPDERALDLSAIGAYHPFDLVEKVRVVWSGERIDLQPLLLLDDTSKLHPDQYRGIERWLVRREMRIARWMLGWGDRLPLEVIIGGHKPSGDEHPGLTPGRDVLVISLREVSVDGDRSEARKKFRRLASQVADRYVARMDIFAERRVTRLQPLLPENRPEAAKDVLQALERRIEVESNELKVSPAVVEGLRQQASPYCRTRDERLELTRILLHRHARRTPQRTLFEAPEEEVETMRVGPHLAEGARVHLLHEHERPLYYGLDTLCDAASMNIEQFLFLSTPLVEEAETRLIRHRAPQVDEARQHELLRARASEAVRQHWRFPHSDEVLRLGAAIARRCITRSLERNASLGPGANALGVPQEEFDHLIESSDHLRGVLHAALTHNALSLVRDHECKKKTWTLLQLNGLLILHYGLSLRWGGFVESKAAELPRFLSGEE